MTSRAQPVNSSHPETPESEAELHREEVALLNEEVNRLQAQLAKFTDDRCYGRCDSPQGLRDWFSYETLPDGREIPSFPLAASIGGAA